VSTTAVAERRYWPSLDGLRGIAIASVIAFHLGLFPGGWVGVDLFFVLSGFLITTLLLDEHEARGHVRLAAFWGRRARRLLPGLLVLLVALGLYAWAGGAAVVPAQLRSPAVATLFYFANWQQAIGGGGYWAHFQAANPLQHTWSLAIEEQYYLVWPLAFVALAYGARRRSWRAAIVLTAALAVASAVWMGVCAHADGVNRAYLGTDTRAWELLLGGLGAMAARRASSAMRSPHWRWLAPLAAVGVALGMAVAGGPPTWIWDGGLVAVACCGLVVIVGSTSRPEAPLSRLLRVPPLRALGLISYSLYLWHWPVIVGLTPTTTGLSGLALLASRCAAMLGIATVSYLAVERPLRQADWGAWWRRALVPATVCAVLGILLAATVPPVAASTTRVLTTPSTRLAGSTVDAPAVTLSVGRVPTSADPLRVWILGDSVMADSAPGVTAALQATGQVQVVADSAFGGWGLTTDPTWSSDSAQIISRYRPEMVIGTWSWDDQAAQSNRFAYLARLTSATQALLAPGTGITAVVLLQFPQAGPNPYAVDPATRQADWTENNAMQAVWNDLARQATTFFPAHALYLSTQDLFAPDGRFLIWHHTPDGGWLRARKLDNAHMCPYGAAELGALVVSDLTPVLGLGPMAAGWELGSWVHDANYNDPPGACPADQPPPGYTGLAVPGPPS
jgi:peptidoglycan/LPS O-acetylase OafA/YrhL